MNEAWYEGRKKSNQDLEQKFEGQQARIDWMNASRKQAEVMASADHSKIEQMDKVCQETVNTVNINSSMMRKVIKQMQKPREISGSELLQAIEQETGSTVNQLIAKRVVQYIDDSVNQIESDKSDIKHDHSVIIRLYNQLEDDFEQFTKSLLIILAGFVLIAVVPWGPLKVVLGIVTLIGGFIYGKN